MIAAYVRVSHRDQEDGESPKRQLDKILEYCRDHGLPTPVPFEDQGKSAVKRRPNWRRLEDLCRAGKVDVLVVYETSRLFRRTYDMLDFVQDACDKRGLVVHTVTDSQNLFAPENRAILTIKAALDEEERRRTSARNKRQRAHMVAEGRYPGSRVPYGYDVVDGRLVPNAEEQGFIALMLDLERQGMGVQAIATALREWGVRTKTGLVNWNSGTVLRILWKVQGKAPGRKKGVKGRRFMKES